jgi:hypothetical protein
MRVDWILLITWAKTLSSTLINSDQNLKSAVDESWLDITDQMNKHSRQLSLILIKIWNQLKVDESWLDITDQMSKHSRQLSLTLIKIWNQLKVDESWWELTLKHERELQLSSTFILVWLGYTFHSKN